MDEEDAGGTTGDARRGRGRWLRVEFDSCLSAGAAAKLQKDREKPNGVNSHPVV